jgi:hypothetical protein
MSGLLSDTCPIGLQKVSCGTIAGRLSGERFRLSEILVVSSVNPSTWERVKRPVATIAAMPRRVATSRSRRRSAYRSTDPGRWLLAKSSPTLAESFSATCCNPGEDRWLFPEENIRSMRAAWSIAKSTARGVAPPGRLGEPGGETFEAFLLVSALAPWRHLSLWDWAFGGEPLLQATAVWRFVVLAAAVVVVLAGVGAAGFGRRDMRAG